MPELTVSMPAYNTGKYIKEAITSVLRQDGVDFELIIVDDCSADNTLEIARSFNDVRIRVIKNRINNGIAYCHNVVIKESKSPFIIHVDSDDIVLPNAFKIMLNKIKSSSKIGQAHCYFFQVDAEGKTSRGNFRKRRKIVIKKINLTTDYKKALLFYGSASYNGLRTYRRDVFDAIGMFDEEIRCGEDYDMAVRIADRYEITLVPEFLYAARKHSTNVSKYGIFSNFVWWSQLTAIKLRLMKNKQIAFLRQKKWSVFWSIITDLCDLLFISSAITIVNTIINFIIEKVKILIRNFLSLSYKCFVYSFPQWPINPFFIKMPIRTRKINRIAYYLWRYPTLSETFIQREIEALKKSGIYVDVIADMSDDKNYFDETAKAFIKTTHYLCSPDEQITSSTKHLHFFFKNPFLFINLFCYVISREYCKYKDFKMDVEVFKKAVSLATALKEKNIDHIHSPWANNSAFISLIASRLVGVSYSVQARASADIHSTWVSHGLPERLKHTAFIITNTQYNSAHLRSLIDKGTADRINIIYDGVDLDRFRPKDKREYGLGSYNLLCVARLIETKGLVYLLEACKILHNKEYIFKCNIVGGPDKSYMDYYIKLKMTYKQLELQDNVSFVGSKAFDAVMKMYDDSDMFILPCVIAKNGSRDITPNSLIEAMAMKLPVISTNISAIPEIVENEVSGILVKPNDADAIAEAIIRLINDRQLRKTLGENARKRVEEKFNIRKNILNYTRLFNGDINQSRYHGP